MFVNQFLTINIKYFMTNECREGFALCLPGAAAPPKKKGRGRGPSLGSQLSRSSRKAKRQLLARPSSTG